MYVGGIRIDVARKGGSTTPKKTIYVSAEDQKILDANPELVASRLFSEALRRWNRENPTAPKQREPARAEG